MGYTWYYLKKLKRQADFEEVEKEQGIGLQTYEKFTAVKESLPYYNNRALRKNGVIAVMAVFVLDSKDTDPDAWMNGVRTWLKFNFIIGWGNVIYFDLRDGEAGRKEICSIFVPVTQEGKISYESYFGGKGRFNAMLSGYAVFMEQRFSLKRLPAGSIKASTEKTFSVNGKLVQALPTVEKNESADEYKERADAAFVRFVIQTETRMEKVKGSVSAEKDSALFHRYVEPYMEFIQRYGGLEKVEKMLKTAMMCQYAVRSMQENGNKEDIKTLQSLLAEGKKYMELHHIT